jgi:photosystem II stability/assembly factor-like uncharacterized protein
MKFFLLLMIFMSSKCFSQWTWQNPLPQGNELKDISYLKNNNNYGWVVGYNGTIIRNTNLDDWEIQNSGTTEILNAIYIIDQNTAHVVGNNGMILKTVNGGSAWISQNSGSIRNLNEVCFLDVNNGYVVGEYGTILKTIDGGTTWTDISTEEYTGAASIIRGVDFINSSTGWICGNGGKIFKTTDGGVNWTLQSTGTTANVMDIDAIDMNIVYAVVNNNIFLSTTNSGSTWNLTSGLFTNAYLNKVEFLNSATGYVTTVYENVYKTTNSGETWSEIGSTSTGDWINGLELTNDGTVFIAGKGGRVEQYSSGTWTKLASNFNSAYNYALVGVKFFDSNNGIVFNEKKILKSTNGGSNWSETVVINTEPVNFYNGFFRTINTGWLVGAYWTNGARPVATIYKTTNGGSSWTNYEEYSIPYKFLNSIDFFDDNFGCAVGSSGVFVFTTNGGSTYSSGTISGTPTLNSIKCLSSSLYFAIGNDGIIAKTTDGASSWTTNSISGVNTHFRDIHFYGLNNGWIVGENGKIYKTTDGGINWSAQTSGTANRLQNIYFINDQKGWICGDNGELLITSDGGENWVKYNSGTSNQLRSVFFLNTLEGWMTGSNGTILHSTDGGLPVELTSFNASFLIGKVFLNWQTATEINNYGFDIERTSELSSEWANIGFVAGHGNSNSLKEYSFIDEPKLDNNYLYRLKQIDTDGKFTYSKEISVETYRSKSLPSEYALYDNYPNPFNPTTNIRYQLPADSKVKLTVYDILGNAVVILVDKEQAAGKYEIAFDANKYGLSSGVYFYRLNAGEHSYINKMILMK